ncbi:MAG: LysR family transcriptional regulator [Luteolibacter sp.]
MRKPPNLHHLELFYYVVKGGGITAASRVMPYGIQQPAISGQIAALEAELGARLFQRRPFTLTPAGRQLFDFIAPFFGKLPEVAAQIAGKASSHLRLAARAIASRQHLPAIIADMREKKPELEVSLIDSSQRRVFEMLEREELDLAIMEIDTDTPPGIRIEPIVSLPFVLLLPPGMRMPKGGLKELAATCPLIRTPSDTPISRLLEKGLSKRSIHWPARIEVATVDLIDAYVRKKLGVGLSLRIPGVEFSKGVKVIELENFPGVTIAGLWRGKLHPLAEEVLGRLKRIAG